MCNMRALQEMDICTPISRKRIGHSSRQACLHTQGRQRDICELDNSRDGWLAFKACSGSLYVLGSINTAGQKGVCSIHMAMMRNI